MSGAGRAIRYSTVLAVAAVALVAGWVSYEHALAVVRAHGETGAVARVYPVTVDGLIYSASMVLLDAARRGVQAPRLARWLLACGIGATLAANVAAGVRFGLVGAVVAAWPALALVGSYELLMMIIRSGAAPAPGRLEVTAEVAPVALSGAPDDEFPAVADDATVSGQPDIPAATARQKRRTQADIEAEVLAVLSRQPGISGAELGRSVGVSGRTGQRLLTRLTNGETASTEDAAP